MTHIIQITQALFAPINHLHEKPFMGPYQQAASKGYNPHSIHSSIHLKKWTRSTLFKLSNSKWHKLCCINTRSKFTWTLFRKVGRRCLVPNGRRWCEIGARLQCRTLDHIRTRNNETEFHVDTRCIVYDLNTSTRQGNCTIKRRDNISCGQKVVLEWTEPSGCCVVM